MNYDLANAARLALGRGLIVTGRHLSRTGARLLRHPSAGRPPLRVVQPATTAAAVHDIRRGAL